MNGKKNAPAGFPATPPKPPDKAAAINNLIVEGFPFSPSFCFMAS